MSNALDCSPWGEGLGGIEEGVKEGDVAQTGNPAQPPEWGLEAAHDHRPQREEHQPPYLFLCILVFIL